MPSHVLKPYLLSIALIGCLSCSSGPKTLNTEVTNKGATQDGVIGIKNDKIVLHKETHAQDELRTIQWTNNKLEDDLSRDYKTLKWCREDMADPRLGGTGELTPLPEIDQMKQTSEVKEEFGVNKEGDLSFITEEDFLKRIQIERNFQTTLSKMIKTVTTQKEECERRMGQARVKAGLPAKRHQGQSTVTPEGNLGKIIHPHENSLDDAFHFLEQKKEKKDSSE